MRSLLIIALIAALALPAYADEEACDMLFVQNAKAMAFDGNRLTLKGADPNIIFFCDRPVRTAGHMTREAFMKLVTEGEDSFAVNPPNAAVSIFGEGTDIGQVVATLIERPVEQGDDMIFKIKVLEGNFPSKGGAVVMFIDPIGRPLSPVSVAGVHRRHRRRAMRHIVR
jgi:hypothetical protein